VRIGEVECPILQRYHEQVGGLRNRNPERPHDGLVRDEVLEFRDELLPRDIVHWRSV
jgi:hypothetical protein